MIYKKETYTEAYVQYNEDLDVNEIINYTEVFVYIFGIKVAESIYITTQEIEEENEVVETKNKKSIGFKKGNEH